MTIETLELLNDEELQAVIRRAGELLKEHDSQRKQTAMEQARAILAAAGLNFLDAAGQGKQKAVKAAVYPGGRNYRHPARSELVWNAKGQKPNWLRQLEREGGRAVEVRPSPATAGMKEQTAANDNAKAVHSPAKAG